MIIYKIGSKTQRINVDKQINIDTTNELFNGLKSKEKVYCYHYDYLKIVPLKFKIIATDDNENGMIYAIKHCSKPIYGVQFHPEFSNYPEHNLMNGTQIYKNFLDICGVDYNDDFFN